MRISMSVPTRPDEADHALGEVDGCSTGSPISSMKTSPPSANTAACSTSCTASCTLMKNRVMPGVGDRDRAARRDLPGERRDDAAPAARARCRTAPSRNALPCGRVREHDLLADPLRRAHHARRAHGLVGRDEDEPLDPDADRGVDDVAGADDVGGDRLARVVLEQRHVLVRGGVEHDVGAEPVGRPRTRVAVADVGEHLLRRHVEAGGGVVQVGLVVVEEDELGGLERRPGARSRSRSSRRPGDEHSLPATSIADRFEVGDDLLAAEEVLDAQVADVLQRHRAGDDVGDAGQHVQRDTGGLGGLDARWTVSFDADGMARTA